METKPLTSRDEYGDVEELEFRRQISTLGIRHRSWLSAPIITYLNILLFVSSILILIGAISQNSHSDTPVQLLRKTNSYSPLLDKDDTFSFHNVIFNESLFNDPWTIYKAEPSEEVDRAWDELTKSYFFPISTDEVVKMGKNPTHTVRVPEDWGYGSDAHLAQSDSQHLIHCLDALRRYSNYNYYFREKWGDIEHMPPIQVAHRSHCIGNLLDALICQPSLHAITHDWMEKQNNPFPDFNVQRQCINYSDVTGWLKKKAIPMSLIGTLKKPEGARQVPILKQLVELSRNGGNWKHDHES